MPVVLCPVSQQVLRERIGSGAYGIAYSLRIAGREYVVKEQPLYYEGELRRAPIIEAVMLSSLVHPGIISLLEVCIQDGNLQLIEEAGGRSLLSWLDANEGNELAVQQLAVQAECITSFLHSNLIYHNDVSLQNLLVNDEGQLSLIDFGLASIKDDDGAYDLIWREWLGRSVLRVPCPIGTVRYAPEVRTVQPHEEAYRLLYPTIHDYLYPHVLHLLAATTELPDSDLLFVAASYLVLILYRRPDVEPLVTATGIPADDITTTAIQLAVAVNWLLLY